MNVSEDEIANSSFSQFQLCSQCYYATYSYCQNVCECALCGKKSKHCAGVDKSCLNLTELNCRQRTV